MPAGDDSAARWLRTYAQRPVGELSWTEPVPSTSLELIAEAAPGRGAAVIDAGGGASRLAGKLIEIGYTDVTVADISTEALDRAQADLGEDAARVTWIEADLRDHNFGRRFDLWHDRAVLHFMVAEADREGYLRTLDRALVPGGHLVLATFSPEGPNECSGLPVTRYDAAGISKLLGDEYRVISSRSHKHETPAGRVQRFIYTHFERQFEGFERS